MKELTKMERKQEKRKEILIKKKATIVETKEGNRERGKKRRIEDNRNERKEKRYKSKAMKEERRQEEGE